MDLAIRGKTALITGAQGGIGLATAKCLAAEGVSLVLSDMDAELLSRAADEIDGDPLCVVADVTDQAEIDALVRQGVERFGAIDIVVHAAGVTGAKGDPLELSDDDYEHAWQIDCTFEEAIESFLEEERPGIVAKRRGEADEVAFVIAMLASQHASFVNGSNVRVDGGSVISVQS
ncbi:SDR family oxidoreductase [Salinicola corii]|uniref:SDR family oxidoreductase n=1 Tax=Salinicola corii TaxID=2606937 RepID=A0A640WC65_9GAMM|nr:SDR family oxidoreductase [Salinicola corii]KAA0017226.1 SDR family oxidoreductase [Salinicola corii]